MKRDPEVERPPSEAAEPRDRRESSYGQILRSSALIGASQVVVIAIGIVRTKAMAVLLGPAGFGLWGLFNAVLDLATSVAGMGVGSSGVRQIAESAASGDTARIGRTVVTLRRTSLCLGLLGASAMIVCAGPIAQFTFGSTRYEAGVALLGAAVAVRLVTAGQLALLQGLRRIRDAAATNAWGALLGSVGAVAFVYALGEDGIALGLAALAAGTLVFAWRYARRVDVDVDAGAVSRREMRAEASALLRLGAAFMGSAVLMMGAAYLVRTMVLRLEGADAAGLFQAAWTLGGLYIGIVLQAMGADFYPRLTGSIGDHPTANRLVNEQAQVSALMASPGIVATLMLAPVLMIAFYSAEFVAAAETLRWICLGMAMRILSWPMGYIVVAKGNQWIFFLTELAWAVVNVTLSWFCVRSFGLEGAGIAFFVSYVLHAVMIYAVVRTMTGFRWTRDTTRISIGSIAVVAVAFGAGAVLPTWIAAVAGIAAAAAMGVVAVKIIVRLIGLEALPAVVRASLTRVRLL